MTTAHPVHPGRAVAPWQHCCAALLGILSAAHAIAGSTSDQLLVTAANSSGNSVYDLNISSSSASPPAPIIASTITPINSAADAKTHGSFDSLVWVSNAYCKSLDLVVADSSKGQIVRYQGASTVANCYKPASGGPTVNPTAQIIYQAVTGGTGPRYPNGLSVDSSGNLFVLSVNAPLGFKPSIWVLPFNQSANLYCANQPAGAYCAPVLIDNRFNGQVTLLLADTVVANTSTPLWNAGDLLVLVGDSFAARLTVYSKNSLYTSHGLLNTAHLNLNGPTSVAISFKQFLQVLAAPFGMDLWPADPAHGIGVSVLIATIDGRILRFDTGKSAFVANFASGLGGGLQKLKVGSFANTPYAFVAQEFNGGRILAFGAPPASGSNKPLAVVSGGVTNPVGLAITNSGSAPVPQNCTDCTVDPLGPAAVTTYTAPPGVNFTGTVTETNCIVPADPRVSTVSGWSCNGTALPIGAGTAYCPSFPAAVIPGSVCGHSGPTGSGFAAIEATATGIDPVANNTFFQTTLNIDAVLPGTSNLKCTPYSPGGAIPLTAWGTRSDLTTVEGTMAEDTLAIPNLGGSPGYLSELTSSCDTSTSGGHGISIFAYGLALSDPSPSYVYSLQADKYQALEQTISDASIAAATQSTLATTVNQAENYVTAAQAGIAPTQNIDCALAQIYATDVFLRAHLGDFTSNLLTTGAGGGNPDPSGDIDSRLANWYLTLNTGILGNAPPSTPTASGYPLPFPVPANSVPLSCYTIGGTVSGLPTSGTGLTGLELQNNGGDNLLFAIGANGNFSFPTALPGGSLYNVTVLTSPPGDSCIVSNGSGTVGNANVTNVSVVCSPVGSGQPSITNMYYIYNDANNNPIDNIEFSESNLFNCNVGDILYAVDNNDAQYNLSALPGAGSYNVGFYVPLPDPSSALWGTNTITLTCYGGPGTMPVFGGPVVITNPSVPAPAAPLAIADLSADVVNNALKWHTTNATANTKCALLDEFGNQPAPVQSPYPQAPQLNVPSTTDGQPNNEWLYPYNSAPSCPETALPDTVTLTCADPTNGAAAKALMVQWRTCIE